MRFGTFLWLNLRRRKARSLLTGGGIAVAVGTAVALLGISHGFQRSAAESLGSGGVEVIVVQAGVLDQLSSDLDQSLADRIAAVPGVADVSPGLLELIDYPKSSDVISVLIQGWEPGTFLFNELEFLAGAPYKLGDQRVAVLGETIAENLKKSVGDTVTIQRREFEVVGIYRSFGVFENGAITIPLDQLQDVMVREESVTGFSLRLDHSLSAPVKSEDVCRVINDLADEEGEFLGLNAMATQEYVSNMIYLKMAHAMAWMTSLIAISVGTLGMLNTMLMSVVERVREISILRAVGWRKSRVVRMILGECVLISVGGAAVGSLAAVLITRWLTTFPAASGFIRSDIAPIVIVTGFALAVLVALIGGAYPAYRASRLRPADGLSHE